MARVWDSPRILVPLAGLLTWAAALALLAAAAVYVVRLPQFALREVVLTEPPARVPAADLAAAVARLRGNFFTLDLDAARREFEALPWVRAVRLSRRWPDGLEVGLTEHTAVAHWGNAALVNPEGRLFRGETREPLPVLSGPPNSEARVLAQYRRFAAALPAIGRKPETVALSARGNWRVRLDDGLTLELGREAVEARLARFLAAYPLSVARLGVPVTHADLRYPSGFALRLPDGVFKDKTDGQKAG